MTVFKKKNNTKSAILPLLYDAYKRAREDNKNYFQYLISDDNKPCAEQFCKKNHLIMTVDYINNGNIIYKFII